MFRMLSISEHIIFSGWVVWAHNQLSACFDFFVFFAHFGTYIEVWEVENLCRSAPNENEMKWIEKGNEK